MRDLPTFRFTVHGVAIPALWVLNVSGCYKLCAPRIATLASRLWRLILEVTGFKRRLPLLLASANIEVPWKAACNRSKFSRVTYPDLEYPPPGHMTKKLVHAAANIMDTMGMYSAYWQSESHPNRVRDVSRTIRCVSFAGKE